MTLTAKKLHIQIDGQTYEVIERISGEGLYRLGNVKADYDLFREIRGQGDDELIQNTDVPIPIHEGDVFYSAKRTLNPGAAS